MSKIKYDTICVDCGRTSSTTIPEKIDEFLCLKCRKNIEVSKYINLNMLEEMIY